ncbi:MAG: phosphoribosyltransferase [Sphaerochaetaceae bacterium]|jgi:hypoxanthine phosphoribosyltransferase|nr:phosphoribosyltransferase [Sphaerochaetaceae bacterium]MDD3163940.1 phosphoribosyltransferase [Sphaerochaetaceae bacterium]MDD4007926.1 phosphoribosyltransferase [Sphaerochaetaceae bacterium]MDD4397212.1 phosphoribosyltransferase [Sphaerochaetaceae bacterium]
MPEDVLSCKKKPVPDGTEKLYVSYETVHKLVKKLAGQMHQSGFDPDVIVAIGSGGFIPARIMKTFISKPIYAVGISYYGVGSQHADHPSKIQWIDEMRQSLAGKKILLIDEVDDTRATLAYCVRELLKYNPEEIAVFILHNKLKKKDDEFPPEIKRYYPAQEVGDVWIRYPWDALDIDEHNRLEALQSSKE